MAVISILRDVPNNVSIVRMISTDTSATIVSANYIKAQMPNINALNSGPWQWYTTDFIICSASDINAIYTFTDATFSTLEKYGGEPGGGINPGLINDIAYYAAAGSTISPLATADNAVMVTNGTGVPSFSTTLPTGLIIPGYTSINWVDQISSTATLAINTGYVNDNGATLVNYTLPAVSPLGSIIEIYGKSAGLFYINQRAGQQIIEGINSTTVGTGGVYQSTAQYDYVRLVCITSNLTWGVTGVIGNPNFV